MYEAIVAKIERTAPIEGADRIHTAYVLGEQVVVSKGWEQGKVGLFFTSDTQLSQNFMVFNNLYRDSKLNRDTEKKGFFDTNRRVRCQPFLKVRSEGFFCELDSLAFCGENAYMDLQVGDRFEKLNGYPVCCKYLNEKTANKINNKNKNKRNVVTEVTPMFNKHMDTNQFKHCVGKLVSGDLLSFHAKIHGTSARYSYSKVIREPKGIKEKILDKLGLFTSESWEYLAGSRNVVLHKSKYAESGTYGSDAYRFEILERLKPHLNKGMSIYGEIAGYANGSPIMSTHSTKGLKDTAFKAKYGSTIIYKYGCTPEEYRFHIYRVTYVNEEGVEIDYSNDQVISWCNSHGFLPPLTVFESFIYQGDSTSLVSLVDTLTERYGNNTEDYVDPSHVSEGVVIRVDNSNLTPTFYKSKSYAFKVMEGILKESGDIDLEEIS